MTLSGMENTMTIDELVDLSDTAMSLTVKLSQLTCRAMIEGESAAVTADLATATDAVAQVHALIARLIDEL